MKHNSSHKANSVVFWFLWAIVADGISSIPSVLAKSQLFISICLFLILTMSAIYSNCSSYSNNYCKIPFVVKFNVCLLNNNLQIFFFLLLAFRYKALLLLNALPFFFSYIFHVHFHISHGPNQQGKYPHTSLILRRRSLLLMFYLLINRNIQIYASL